jgi:hypothetical protein
VIVPDFLPEQHEEIRRGPRMPPPSFSWELSPGSFLPGACLSPEPLAPWQPSLLGEVLRGARLYSEHGSPMRVLPGPKAAPESCYRCLMKMIASTVSQSPCKALESVSVTNAFVESTVGFLFKEVDGEARDTDRQDRGGETVECLVA